MADITIVESLVLTRQEAAIINHEWEINDRALYGDDYDDYEWGRHVVYFKGVYGGEFAGYIRLEVEAGVGFIDEILVFERYRNVGVGTTLLERVEEYATKNKCHKLSLETDQTLSSLDLFVRQGFTNEAILKHHYGDRDSLIMSKILYR